MASCSMSGRMPVIGSEKEGKGSVEMGQPWPSGVQDAERLSFGELGSLGGQGRTREGVFKS